MTVRSVNERVLPELDDAFATTTGFTSVEELRNDVRSRFERMRKLEQGIEARDQVLDALLAAVDMPLPESVVEAEIEWRRESMGSQLQQAGQTLGQFLESQGKGEEEFEEELRATAAHAVKAQFVLDAVADAEQIGVTEPELSDQIVRRAQQARVSPSSTRRRSWRPADCRVLSRRCAEARRWPRSCERPRSWTPQAPPSTWRSCARTCRPMTRSTTRTAAPSTPTPTARCTTSTRTEPAPTAKRVLGGECLSGYGVRVPDR